MGAWGDGPLENDNGRDVADKYEVLRSEGLSPQEAAALTRESLPVLADPVAREEAVAALNFLLARESEESAGSGA